ncbi:MAG: hypothetical protein CMH83_13790 [Nocardioides sp.]|nr:hypothetical protein [Nocardioides sp.]
MTVSELHDAGAPVRGGRPAGPGGEIDALADECGFLLPAIDWAIEKVTGTSLLAEVLELCAGDFEALGSVRAVWGQVADSLDLTGANYLDLADHLPDGWTGEGRRRAVRELRVVGVWHRDQNRASRMVSDQLGHVLEIGRIVADVVAGAISLLDALLTELLIDAAAGPIGWAKGVVTGPGIATRAVTLVHRVLEALGRLRTAAATVSGVVRRARVALLALEGTTGAAAGGAGWRAGTRTDDTARAAFT